MKPGFIRWYATGRRYTPATAAAGLALATLLPAPRAVRAQAPADSTACASTVRPGADRVGDDISRLLELTGDRPLIPGVIRRGLSLRPATCGAAHDPLGADWYGSRDSASNKIAPVPVRVVTVYNSRYPRDANNGALWAGRGLSTGVRGGARVRYGVLSAAVAPEIYYQSNGAFSRTPANAPGISPFGYPWHGGTIDLPLRHGPDAFVTLDAGNSYVRADVGGFAAGLSNENVWWGPALHNPLMFSNTAPGFAHGFIGTSRPLDIGIGRIEAEALWGVLHESDWYDDDPDNDRRLLAGLVIDFEPAVLPGVFLGFSRVFATTLLPGRFSFFDYIIDPYRGVRENPLTGAAGDNQILSIFGRFVAPGAGLEAWAEWARDDHWVDLEDLLKEPDHGQAYTIGVQKVVRLGGTETAPASRWLRVYGEFTHLQSSITVRAVRPAVTFYTNGSVTQGHTQRGQMLGAAIGPGSDAQNFGADVFTPRGRFGLHLQRIRYDDDAYYSNFARFYAFHGHDVELTGGLRGLLLLRDLEIEGEITYSHRYNRNFVGLERADFDALFSDHNFGVQVSATWRPRYRLLF